MAGRKAPAGKISWKKYWTLANRAWKQVNRSQGNGKKQCESCVGEARRDRQKAPLFPSSFDGKCPRCGGELRSALPV